MSLWCDAGLPPVNNSPRRNNPMTIRSPRAERIPAATGSVEFDADVLVIGGGPAGTWAAVSAAKRGAREALPFVL